LYDIRPGNVAGLFLQPRNPHGARRRSESADKLPHIKVVSHLIGVYENVSERYKTADVLTIVPQLFFDESHAVCWTYCIAYNQAQTSNSRYYTHSCSSLNFHISQKLCLTIFPAPCALRSCKNGPAPFPGRMS